VGKVLNHLFTNLIIFSTLLSILLPLLTYKLNQKIHNYGDPPWKRQEKSDDVPLQKSEKYSNKNE
jgi:hypothetical protein